MSVCQEIDIAHTYFMENDPDARKEGAQYFFASVILNRFELALEMVEDPATVRQFRDDSSRNVPTLNQALEKLLEGETAPSQLKNLIEGMSKEAKAYLKEKRWYSGDDRDFAIFHPDIQLRYAKEAMDGDQFCFSLEEVRDLLGE